VGMETPKSDTLRATLHLEARPIQLLCQRPRILTCDWTKPWNWSQTPLHLEARPIWRNKFFHPQRHELTWPNFAKLGAPKMEGQCHILILKNFFIKKNSFNKSNPLDIVQSASWCNEAVKISTFFSLFFGFYRMSPASWPQGLYTWENWPPLSSSCNEYSRLASSPKDTKIWCSRLQEKLARLLGVKWP